VDLHAATLYEAIADEQPDALALAHGDVRRTWREFDDRAARLAAGFVAAGLTVGSRIAIDLYNSNEFLEAFFAALKVRCLPVAINYRYLDDELWYLLDNCRAEAVLYHASMAERVRRVVPRLDTIRLLVEVDTASDAPRHEAVAPYEELLAANDPRRASNARSTTRCSRTRAVRRVSPRACKHAWVRPAPSCRASRA